MATRTRLDLGWKFLLQILLLLSLQACLMMDGSAPSLNRTDLAVYPDYSGTYLSYKLDEARQIVPELPTQLTFFEKLSEGEYRFAVLGAGETDPTLGGYLYLLDVGKNGEVVGLMYGRSVEGKDQAAFMRIQRVSDYRFDVAAFSQRDPAKYSQLMAVAKRHGISLNPDKEGYILGRPTGGQLRAAYADRDFVANIEFDLETAYVRQDPHAAWPERVVLKDVANTGLAIVEDSPAWQTAFSNARCSLLYGSPNKDPLVAVHAVRGKLALEVRLPGYPADGATRVRLDWQVDNARPHSLWSEHQLLDPSTLVVFPFERRLMEELARGQALTLSAGGILQLRLPLKGSARATVSFSQCIGKCGHRCGRCRRLRGIPKSVSVTIKRPDRLTPTKTVLTMGRRRLGLQRRTYSTQSRPWGARV